MGALEVNREDLNKTIEQNYRQVLDKISEAAIRTGRSPDQIRLVVVTKLQPVEVIQAAIQAGARVFGENYAEQAAPKIEALRGQSAIEWHMIGHIQSRKAPLVCEHFSMVHSLDSVKLAEKLEGCLTEMGKVLPVLLEFNLGGEETKHGWDAIDESGWESFLPDVERILACHHLKVSGCMTMPPYAEDPELARPYFQKLRQLSRYLSMQFPATEWAELSMGTSGDYEVAVEEGATLVRIGQAILGPRPVRG